MPVRAVSAEVHALAARKGTMRAELRHLFSPDVKGSLADYRPDDPENFGILVQAFIGPQGGLGEESFEIVVCSPRWFASTFPSSGYYWGRHHLFVRSFSYAVLRQAIENLCLRADGANWEAVANQLSLYTRWEFEDYDDSPETDQ